MMKNIHTIGQPITEQVYSIYTIMFTVVFPSQYPSPQFLGFIENP